MTKGVITGQITFDTFTGVNGSAVNSALWDTAVTLDGALNIQSNAARLDSSSSSCNPLGSATLTLKTALTTGKIIMLMTTTYFKNSGSPYTDYGHIIYQVGNDTDGWTEVYKILLNPNGDSVIVTAAYSPSFEAIYAGSNQWDIIIGGNPQSTVTKANGLKTRIIAYSEGASSIDTVQISVNTVYIE